ncbi:hypothetical protein DFP72DRAFT_900837 [Ephemerocybe angulata]|uniref:RapZ C-terminal domain-containing protein n=1 Tax=Ephemerocybe angulata TaxID=980116 RepID=A0A8H6M375_9AGAR|nr:hypothetical protein DFP72DRAFT_900837 [Tulosesus angulatus]
MATTRMGAIVIQLRPTLLASLLFHFTSHSPPPMMERSTKHDIQGQDPNIKTLRIRSFGRRYGPLFPDSTPSSGSQHPTRTRALTFDVRSLPNPPKDIRMSYSGLSKPLQEWLFSKPEVVTRVDEICREVERSLSDIQEGDDDGDNVEGEDSEGDHGRVSLDVGICCQLGRNRSVAVVETLGRRKWPEGWRVEIGHRDVHQQRHKTHSKRKGLRGGADRGRSSEE